MKYRTFPKLPDLKLSQFGMGLMRLPMVDGNYGEIKRKATGNMVNAAIKGGVNYFDTGYTYHEGDCEKFAAETVVPKLDSHNLHLAAKLPQWLVKEKKDYDKYLDEQLNTLGLNQIEFYLIHSLHDTTWKKHKELGMMDFLKRAVNDGRIKYPCFSYHGTLDAFKEIVDSYDDWIMAQIMLNYVDENWQAGVEGMKYAYKRDVGIVVMEPLKGGLLTKKLPKDIKETFTANDTTPVKAAMKWCYDLEEPTVVLSGVSTLPQTLGQIEIADKAAPGCLSQKEKDAIKIAKENFKAVPCSACEYCQPCPFGVKIPNILEIYNEHIIFKNNDAKSWYKRLVDTKADAGHCTVCGACEKICPQEIDIIEKIKQVHKKLS